MRDFTAPQPVDVVLCHYFALNYLLTHDDLRRCFAATTPILLYGCNTVSCVTAALLHTKLCHVVQTAWEMRLAIREAVDNPGAPAASCRPTEESVP